MTARTQRSPPTVRSSRSSTSPISTCPCTSYYFDCDDVALKNFAKCFLHQSHKEREHAGNWWSYKKQVDTQNSHQDIKKPNWDHWESELNAMECMLHLKNKCKSVSTGTAQTGIDKNRPTCVISLRHMTWMSRWNSLKNWVTTIINLHKMGALEPGTTEPVFDKHTLEDSDPEG